MAVFSEESRLLIEHWNTVEEIFEAEKRLRMEINSILLSVKPEIAGQEWWQTGWKFVEHGESQVYISNRNWQVDDDYVVWIGIENFNPEAVFGMEAPSSLYVWVSGKRNDLAQMLTDKIQQIDAELLGELDNRQSGYVVRQAVKKYLLGETEHYGDAVKEQIMNFFVHYAKVVWKLDSEIRRYLKKK